MSSRSLDFAEVDAVLNHDTYAGKGGPSELA